MNSTKTLLCLFSISAVALFGCRRQLSNDPPVQLIQNMVDQSTYGPQSANSFYKDGLAARAPVEGTVAQGEENTDSRLYLGLEPKTTDHWVAQSPFRLTDDDLKRGQERYGIYCAPCHGYAGNNDGLVTIASGGTVHPASFYDKEKISLPIGKIYNAITFGLNNWNMPGFSEQMSVEDRWKVAAYVKALQRSRSASLNEIPADIKNQNKWSSAQ